MKGDAHENLCLREVFALEQKLKQLQERIAAIDTSIAFQDAPRPIRQAIVGRNAAPPDVGRYVGQDTGVRFVDCYLRTLVRS
jgi:hypothetical protein